MVCVTEKDDFSNARLDDHFGTVVTGKQRNINGGSLDIGAAFVENGVELSVADVEIFGVDGIWVVAGPRQLIIGAPGWETVVAQSNYPLFIVDDTSPNLSVWIF